ncbi:hypothetical protein FCN80_11585 [Martelella alba]|uniref:Big-1 domain-containing protein n=1 Tax=Martelella alba TaxID=2590451 RepID=A0ABY2SL26_9HYPH|nr:hypothetical protein FCN80_11585 [Martelella alba]
MTNENGEPQSGDYLFFSATGNAKPAVAYGTTNGSGQFLLTVTNPVAENVLITANTNTTPPASNTAELTFTPAPPNYVLTSTLLSDNAIANGVAQNTVRLMLTDANTGLGVSGRIVAISANGPADYPSSVYTDSAGYAYLAISSTEAGTLTVTCFLQSDPTVTSVSLMTFAQSYPRLVATHSVYLSGYVGIHKFMAGVQVMFNHRYHISLTRQPSSTGKCGTNAAVSTVTNSCTAGIPARYTLLAYSLEDAVATDSGNGSDLAADVYYNYSGNNIGESYVEVYDYGPYYSTLSEPGSVLINDSAENVPTGNSASCSCFSPPENQDIDGESALIEITPDAVPPKTL